MAKNRKTQKSYDDEKIIQDLISNKEEQVKALRKVLDHFNEVGRKKASWVKKSI